MTRLAECDAVTMLPGARMAWRNAATTVSSSRPFVTAAWLEGSFAQQVSHAEGTGVKVAKHRPFDQTKLVKEVEDALLTAFGVVVHHDVIDQVRAGIARAGIAEHCAQHVALDLVDEPSSWVAGGHRGGC